MRAGLLSLAVSQPAFAADAPIAFEPSAPWAVDYRDNSCALSRVFISEAGPIAFQIEAFDQGSNVNVRLVGSPIKDVGPSVEVRWRKDGPGHEMNFLFPTQSPDGIRGFFAMTSIWSAYLEGRKDDGPFKLDTIGDAEEIQFGGKLDPVVTLKTGPMAPALDALKKCTDDLVASWDLDPQVQRKLSRDAESKGISLTTPLVKASGHPAGVPSPIRVLIGENGRVTDCKILSDFLSQKESERVCSQIKRQARFSPALDEAGEPVATYHVEIGMKFRG